MRRCVPPALLLLSLIAATPALAADNGEGLLGETDDKVVTFFSLGVLVFFVLAVIVGSALQGFLEKRKDARKAVELRRRIDW
jgi:hypothetical protein